MSFRPLPILTLFTLVVLGVLIHLGVWQMNRATWKAEEIAAYQSRAASDVLEMEAALCRIRAARAGQRINVPTDASLGEPVRVYGFSTAGEPGWRLYTPIPAPDCLVEQGEDAVLAELGFEAFKTGQTTAISQFRIEYFGVEKSAFTSDNKPDENEWYWIDMPAVNAALFPDADTKISTRFIVIADDGLPAHLRKTPPERHIGYSVTWFGMAIALLVMYAAYHVHAGRLRFGAER